MNFNKLLGYAWASPLSLLGLLYVLPHIALGYYTWDGVHGVSLVWRYNVNEGPEWLRRRWRGWAAFCLGNVAVMKFSPTESVMGEMCLRRVNEHAEEAMQLGIMWPISYVVSRLWRHRW